MIIYFLIVIVALCLWKINFFQTRKKLYIFIMGLIFFVVSGFRNYTVGVDTFMYTSTYDMIGLYGISGFERSRFEIGFKWFCLICTYISKDYTLLLVMTSLIITAAHMFFIYKNSKNIPLSICLYVFLNRFFINMNSMRQVLAISILLVGYEILKSKLRVKMLLYILLVLLAFSFHTSALLGFILILVKLKRRFNLFEIVTIIISSLILGIVLNIYAPAIISNMNTYAVYSDSRFASSSILGASLNYLIILIILCVSYYMNHDEKENVELLILVSISLVFFGCALGASIFGRLGYYFSVFAIVLLPNSFKLSKCPQNEYVLLKVTSMAFIFAYFVVILVFRPEWFGCSEYAIRIW